MNKTLKSAIFLLCVTTFLPFGFLSCQQKEEKTVSVNLGERTEIQGKNHNTGAEEPLRIAVAAMISPKETVKHYNELIEYIGSRLDRKIELVQRRTYQEVNDLLENMALDCAFVCSGPYVKGQEKFGMQAIAVPVVNGRAYYHAYFIVRKSSPVNDIDGLRGKIFAFTDPASNTGRVVPEYVLMKMGETPGRFFKKVIYTYSHDNSITAVSKGIVHGASVDSLIYDYYREKDPGFVKNTKIIYKSPPYGIPPIVVNPQSPPSLKLKLKDILLHMHGDREGRRILSALNIEKFIPPNDADYDSVRQMQEWIEQKK